MALSLILVALAVGQFGCSIMLLLSVQEMKRASDIDVALARTLTAAAKKLTVDADRLAEKARAA